VAQVDSSTNWSLRSAASLLSEQEVSTKAYGLFFQKLIGAQHDGAVFSPGNRRWIAVLAVVFALNFICIYRGLSNGIEKLCNYGMPVLFILSFAVLFRVLALGTPDPAKPDQNAGPGKAGTKPDQRLGLYVESAFGAAQRSRNVVGRRGPDLLHSLGRLRHHH
jgi:hypothetical protein